MTAPRTISVTLQTAFQQRGFNDGRSGNDTTFGEKLAERAGFLAEYRAGLRVGKREAERDKEESE